MDLTASHLFNSPRASSSPLLAAVASFRTRTPRYSQIPVDLSQSLFSTPYDGDVTVIPATDDSNNNRQRTTVEKMAELCHVAFQSPSSSMRSEPSSPHPSSIKSWLLWMSPICRLVSRMCVSKAVFLHMFIYCQGFLSDIRYTYY